MSGNRDFDTLAPRTGTLRSQFNDNSEAIYLISSFRSENAAQAAARFAALAAVARGLGA